MEQVLGLHGDSNLAIKVSEMRECIYYRLLEFLITIISIVSVCLISSSLAKSGEGGATSSSSGSIYQKQRKVANFDIIGADSKKRLISSDEEKTKFIDDYLILKETSRLVNLKEDNITIVKHGYAAISNLTEAACTVMHMTNRDSPYRLICKCDKHGCALVSGFHMSVAIPWPK